MKQAKQPINDIDLKDWKNYPEIETGSLWMIGRRDNSGQHSGHYHGNFVPQVPHQLMLRYTRAGDLVLDPFSGSGTTFIEGQRLGRHVIGTELLSDVAHEAAERIIAEPNPHKVNTALYIRDCTKTKWADLLQEQGLRSAQLAILHPPYHNIIRFSDNPACLSNCTTPGDFIALLKKAVRGVTEVLDEGRYLALVIGDIYSKGEWIPLGFLAMQAALKEGYTLKSIVVKNYDETAGKKGQKALWRYRALAGGFYLFQHEYIFIMRKGVGS